MKNARKGSEDAKKMTYFIQVEHFAHFLLLRKQKEGEFFIQKIRITKKWIPLMPATCYFLSRRQVTAQMGVFVEDPAQSTITSS